MDIPVVDLDVIFTMRGGEAYLDVDWVVSAASQLSVRLTRDAVTTTLAYGAHYAVAGAGQPRGATVVLLTAALAGDVYRVIGDQSIVDPDDASVYMLARWLVAPWSAGSTYRKNDALHADGSAYICIATHGATAATQPGVGADWETAWDVVASEGDAATSTVEAQAAAAAAAVSAAAAVGSATASALSATTAAAAAATAALFAGISGTYLTKAAMDAAAAGIAANAYVVVWLDETHGGHAAIWQKQASVMTYIRLVEELQSYTFATRPDPANYIGLPGILITNERNGAIWCTANAAGTLWHRTTDGRPAQSAVINYYVDSVAGNDANAGTSEGAAVQSLTQLATLIAALPAHRRHGLWVTLKRGSTWRQRFTPTALMAGIRITAYGLVTAAKPRLIGADVLVNASFSLAPTTTNVYQIAHTVEFDAAFAEWPGMWVDGQRYTYAASLAACNAKPGTFFYTPPTDQTAITLYVHPFGSTNPTTDGKVYEATTRNGCINANGCDYAEVEDIRTEKQHTSLGSLALGRYGIARRCEQYSGNTHNISYRAYCLIEDNLAVDSYGNGESETMYIGFEPAPPVDAWATFRRCRAEQRELVHKARTAITGITQATQAVVTAVAHGLATNEYVTISGVAGMTEVNGRTFMVTVLTADTFRIRTVEIETGNTAFVNSTAYGAWTSGGVVAMAPYGSPVVATIGYFNHTADGSVMWARHDYEDCYAAGCGVAFAAAHMSGNCTIIRPTIRQCFTGFKTEVHTVVRGSLAVETMLNAPAIIGANLMTMGAAASFDMEGIAATLNSSGQVQSTFAGTRITIQNCRFTGFGVLMQGTAANQTWVLKNNVFVPNGRQFTAYNFTAGATGLSLTSDYNNFGQMDGASDFIIGGVTHNTLALYRAATGQDWNSVAGQTVSADRLRSPVGGTLTIAAGVVTVTGSHHMIDTEAAAATDDLDTILGGTDGQLLVLRAVNGARTVVVKDGTGNMQLTADMALDSQHDTLTLMYGEALTVWSELARGNNAT